MILKMYRIDPSSKVLKDVDVFTYETEDECLIHILEEHYQIGVDNEDIIIPFDEWIVENSFDSLERNGMWYDDFEFEIIDIKQQNPDIKQLIHHLNMAHNFILKNINEADNIDLEDMGGTIDEMIYMLEEIGDFEKYDGEGLA